MLTTDVPTLVLVFVLLVLATTGVLCFLNWYRRRGAGVAFLETLRFVTMALILFTLCKPEFHREKPRKEDPQVDILVLADASGSMTTEDVDLGRGHVPLSRQQLLDARLGLIGALTEADSLGERVLQVFQPSPAHTAGLQPGDVITQVDGNSTQSGLAKLLEGRTAGQTLKLAVRRSGAVTPMDLKLAGLGEVLQDELRKRKVEARVYVQPFGKPEGNGSTVRLVGTDINRAILTEAEKHDNLRALLLLSDGDWNIGKSPTEEGARFLRERNATAHVVTDLGRTSYLPDVELVLEDIPSFGVVDDRIAVPFRVRNHLTREVSTNIILRGENNEAIDSKRVIVPARGQSTGTFIWEPIRSGPHRMKVDLPVSPEELFKTNNVQTFAINIQRNTNNVLIIESSPRWEYRFLRNALTRDPDVAPRVLLLHPGMQRGDGNNYLNGFPPLSRTADQKIIPGPVALPDYDLIFLGDVGLGAGGISDEQARQIKNLVEHHSSGLVFMPGQLGNQITFYRWKTHDVQPADTPNSIAAMHGVAPRTLSYANFGVDLDNLKPGTQLHIPHPLADLLPVAFDLKAPRGDWTVNESRFSLLPEGRGNPLLLLGRDEFENEELWKTILPGFFWHAGVLRDVPGSQILAIHSTRRNQYGYLPLLVTQAAGNGQVLFMGTDSAWRWRRGVEDKYHYRFWGQVVRWMAHKRKQAGGQGMHLVFSPERPKLGDTLNIEGILTDWAGVAADEIVQAEVQLPGGGEKRLTFEPVPGGMGNYRAKILLDEAGPYSVRAYTSKAKREVKKSVTAEQTVIEVVGRPINAAMLAQLARDTRGGAHSLANLTPMIEQITEKIRYKPEIEEYKLWAQMWWGGLILFLLAVYWTMRKVLGLI